MNLQKDNNITQRLTRFTNVINEKNFYRVSLRFLCNSGLMNFPVKLDAKLICLLETDINMLLDAVKKVTAIPSVPVTMIIWHDTPFTQYDQITLNNKFRMYIETSVILKKVFRMGTQNTLLKVFRARSRCKKL